MALKLYPLGAGQEVGRSCIILNILDKTIMLDCGLHMTHSNHDRFPNFSKIPANSTGNKKIDLVLITHFHLDHCGALPYLTEHHGYSGPVVMTMPTKALLPYMLEDYRRVWNENTAKGAAQTQQQTVLTTDNISQPTLLPQSQDPLLIYTQEQIKNCVDKVSLINVMETQIHDGIEIKAYYAGHLLGACMFYIKYKGISVVYTGDFNSLSDRHLGAAYIDQLEPDLLISESTYATTIRDTKRTRERNFLMTVQDTLDIGGKVLIPCFALGRAQELSVLLDTYWQRTEQRYKLFYAAGLIEKANYYYRLFASWESEKIQNSFNSQNIFDFKHIKAFDKQLIKSNEPMVLLATPGMLHGGLSMQVFKEWCNNEKNTLIIPGYCVAGTLGNKLLSGVKKVKIDNKEYDVNMSVKNMSFSAHADSKGIIQLICHLKPRNVMFVHGESGKMKQLGELIRTSMRLPVYHPANFEEIVIEGVDPIPPKLTLTLTQQIQKNGPQCVGFLINSKWKQNYFIQSQEELINETRAIMKLIYGNTKDLYVFERYLILKEENENQFKDQYVKNGEVFDLMPYGKVVKYLPLEN